MSRLAGWVRARPGTLAIVCLGIGWGCVMHTMGWAQLAHYSEVRALASGEKTIDRWRWETGDVAWIDGHYYSVKSPGMAALSTPLYLLIDAAGGKELSADAATQARESYRPRWIPNDGPPYASYGYDAARAQRIQVAVEDETGIVWALTLLAAVAPSILLLFCVRAVAERLEPGYGTAAAITLGLCTMLMVFAAEFFSHAISTTLGFAAFTVLFFERRGSPRPWLVAAAGLLAGLAFTFEFQTGLVCAVLFFYAIARDGRLRRGASYAAGAVAGALPALAFNAWALGSPLKFAYSSAVAEIGVSGHASLGLNSDGFFGISLPRLGAVTELILGGRGLAVLTPVIFAALAGIVLMRRRGFRAEAWTITAIAIAYFVYNIGYWQPYGGGTPGPRFLIPALPFVAVGLAFAYRRIPATTLALAIPSGIWMVAASLSYPLLGDQGTGTWVSQLGDGTLEHTLLTMAGVRPNWIAAAPILLAIAGAIVLTFRATEPAGDPDPLDIRLALGGLGVWIVASVVGPTLAGDEVTPLNGGWRSFWVVAIAAVVALLSVAQLRSGRRRADAASARVMSRLALGDRTS